MTSTADVQEVIFGNNPCPTSAQATSRGRPELADDGGQTLRLAYSRSPDVKCVQLIIGTVDVLPLCELRSSFWGDLYLKPGVATKECTWLI